MTVCQVAVGKMAGSRYQTIHQLLITYCKSNLNHQDLGPETRWCSRVHNYLRVIPVSLLKKSNHNPSYRHHLATSRTGRNHPTPLIWLAFLLKAF